MRRRLGPSWLRFALATGGAVVLAAGCGAGPSGTGSVARGPEPTSTLPGSTGETVRVGSKKFTESVILGELARLALEEAGTDAIHRREVGGTRVLWEGLRRGELDVYAEYTGTVRAEILAGETISPGLDALRRELEERGILAAAPLGFDNTYALGMTAARAAATGVRRISDLRRRPELRLGFTNEFLDRGDGWPSLRRTYALPHREVRGVDHDLGYRGLAAGSFDVTDLYSTDAEIAAHDLVILEDDLGHFPEYRALYLVRAAAPTAARILAVLDPLGGTLSTAEMTRMNAEVEVGGRSESAVAASFLGSLHGGTIEVEEEGRITRLARHLRQHLLLVGVSLGAAISTAVPLGILAARRPDAGRVVLGIVGLFQTIPSLALLVFMIPFLGIGAAPAILALFLYSLLPIVRNTHAGLVGIPADLREVAEVLGLSARTRLLRIELPLAAPAILAGIQTAAVINVGTATLGALIGAGGLGQPILTGIRLDDVGLILEGAVPAAVLALVVQWTFDLVERVIVPAGIRAPSAESMP